MTPENKIKKTIMLQTIEWMNENRADISLAPHLDTDQDVSNAWSQNSEDDEIEGILADFTSGFRSGNFETGIEADWSRHFETKSVAAQMPDGSWVGWTYWYGGGKHGEPEAVPWMEYAYDLNVTEEEKVMTVRTWKKVAP